MTKIQGESILVQEKREVRVIGSQLYSFLGASSATEFGKVADYIWNTLQAVEYLSVRSRGNTSWAKTKGNQFFLPDLLP